MLCKVKDWFSKSEEDPEMQAQLPVGEEAEFISYCEFLRPEQNLQK